MWREGGERGKKNKEKNSPAPIMHSAMPAGGTGHWRPSALMCPDALQAMAP